MTLSRRRFLQAASLLAGAATPLATLNANEGLFEAVEFDWADAARQRPVPVRLYLPIVKEPVPLVVFSHGIGSSRRGYRWFGEHLASNGIAALHLQHVGSDRQVWTGGSVFGVVSRLQDAAQDAEAIARATDLRFALDTLLAGPLAGRFDTQRIAAAGHSYGANTTLLVSGARVARGGRVVDLRDPRIGAAIVMSAPPFYGESDLRPILGGITLPILHVTTTEDVIRIPGYHSPFEDRLQVFEATGSSRKWLAVYEGGSHNAFTDRGGNTSPVPGFTVKGATRALALAFLRSSFEGDMSALAAWPLRHAPLLARFTAPALV